MNDDGTFCGVSEEQFAISGRTYQWPKGSHLTWGFNFTKLGSLTSDDIRQAITAALKEISDACDITYEYVANANAANIKITLERLDGQSGTLADCQIPVGNVSVNQTQLLMRIDDSEAWGLFENPPANKIDFYRVILHELLHSAGLGHKPDSIPGTALIAPLYSRQVRNLQAADKAELVRRYGPAKVATMPTTPTAPAGPAPTVPAGVKPNVKLEVTIGGQVWIAEGTLKLKQ